MHAWALANPKWTGYPFSNQNMPGVPAHSVRELTHEVNTMEPHIARFIKNEHLIYASLLLSVLGLLLLLCLCLYLRSTRASAGGAKGGPRSARHADAGGSLQLRDHM